MFYVIDAVRFDKHVRYTSRHMPSSVVRNGDNYRHIQVTVVKTEAVVITYQVKRYIMNYITSVYTDLGRPLHLGD